MIDDVTLIEKRKYTVVVKYDRGASKIVVESDDLKERNIDDIALVIPARYRRRLIEILLDHEEG